MSSPEPLKAGVNVAPVPASSDIRNAAYAIVRATFRRGSMRRQWTLLCAMIRTTFLGDDSRFSFLSRKFSADAERHWHCLITMLLHRHKANAPVRHQ
jgi:hypothetical protein